MLTYFSANWLWILFMGGFFLMHFGRGGRGDHGGGACGSHGGHARETDQHQHEEDAHDAARLHSHQQRDAGDSVGKSGRASANSTR